MSKRRSTRLSLRENEVALDTDSESEEELSDDDSDAFIPSDSTENQSEVSEEEGVGCVDLFTDLPSTSRASCVNVRGGSRRGRGVTTRGRIPLRRLEKEQADQLWSQENIDDPPQAPQFTGKPELVFW